ncbi:hypothetical protein THUN1379_06640 [Paludibacterium sp. THUN1379]|uniref:VENN motif pre-toxin domain-containing protein n=1 Tax=Paludibacterium sp. THUN1379 TaxID=3112107 RepID=UPI003091EFF5|nr:hypothetical protein THUN1379_06640 [Paludibacterium sp. THUN1379]
MAHNTGQVDGGCNALVGGVLAGLSGKDVASGAIGEGSAPLVARAIAKEMYGSDNPEALTQEQKAELSQLTSVAGGLLGMVASKGDAAAAQTAVEAAKNEVENNSATSKEDFEIDKGPQNKGKTAPPVIDKFVAALKKMVSNSSERASTVPQKASGLVVDSPGKSSFQIGVEDGLSGKGEADLAMAFMYQVAHPGEILRSIANLTPEDTAYMSGVGSAVPLSIAQGEMLGQVFSRLGFVTQPVWGKVRQGVGDYLGTSANSATQTGSALTQLQINNANGAAFENKVFNDVQSKMPDAVQQVTIKTQSGTKTRIDIMGTDSSGQVVCVECKSSATAPLTKNQTSGFPEIQQSGGVVVGNGKPGFPGGTVIPPTTVQIIRPGQTPIIGQ